MHTIAIDNIEGIAHDNELAHLGIRLFMYGSINIGVANEDRYWQLQADLKRSGKETQWPSCLEDRCAIHSDSNSTD